MTTFYHISVEGLTFFLLTLYMTFEPLWDLKKEFITEGKSEPFSLTKSAQHILYFFKSLISQTLFWSNLYMQLIDSNLYFIIIN